MNLSIPESHHIYTKEQAKLFEGALLYSYQLMQWEEPNIPDVNSIMFYIDNHQFHYLLAIGKSDNDTIEYCREEAEKFAIELDKRKDSFLPITEDELPF